MQDAMNSDFWSGVLERILGFAPALGALIGFLFLILVVRFIMERRYATAADSRFRLQLTLILLSFIGLLVVIVSLPMSEGRITGLLTLIGILLSAAIALSSTTFVGNIMAGMMLRTVRNFKPGDFIRVGEHFGRVSERSLFHVEIQTEDSDLTTMPNLYLVTNPVKVIRESGTLVSAEVSLGYDVPRSKVKEVLCDAVSETGLEDPFVLVTDLGDFAVTYRASGLLKEVKQLLSTRSRLRSRMLDDLHAAGIEIVSPTFMNQRALPPGKRFIPEQVGQRADQHEDTAPPEKVIFDKADEAESIEKLRERLARRQKELSELKKKMDQGDGLMDKGALKEQRKVLEERAARLAEYIKKRESEQEDSGKSD